VDEAIVQTLVTSNTGVKLPDSKTQSEHGDMQVLLCFVLFLFSLSFILNFFFSSSLVLVAIIAWFGVLVPHRLLSLLADGNA
jgi:hypothetical protein